MANKGGPWYGVSGKRVIGPYDEYANVKFALHVEGHNDEVIVKNGLYRYGAEYIGTAVEINRRNLAKLPTAESAPERKATHYAVVMGQDVGTTVIRTLSTGPWVKLP